MRRVVTLINQLATLHGTSAALQVQVDGNNQAAKKYMKNNELLKQVRLYPFVQGTQYALTRDAGIQSELGVGLLRESLYNDVILSAVQHSWLYSFEWPTSFYTRWQN